MNPVKYLAKDLINKTVPFDVWLQGTAELVDKQSDYVIISDSTGKVKVKFSNSDIKDVNVGDYCCVLGVAEKTNDSPEVISVKFFKINLNHKDSWEIEVEESQLFLQGIVAPKISL